MKYCNIYIIIYCLKKSVLFLLLLFLSRKTFSGLFRNACGCKLMIKLNLIPLLLITMFFIWFIDILFDLYGFSYSLNCVFGHCNTLSVYIPCPFIRVYSRQEMEINITLNVVHTIKSANNFLSTVILIPCNKNVIQYLLMLAVIENKFEGDFYFLLNHSPSLLTSFFFYIYGQLYRLLVLVCMLAVVV